jgi:hypothetical protein
VARSGAVRQAEGLLAKIPRARSEQRRRMLLAAALTKVIDTRPIVVGGTAEAHWAGSRYFPTDLDLCPRPGPLDIDALKALGLQKQGRHWVRHDLPVAVEFPEHSDDIERTVDVRIDGVDVRVIACEDLYLDRVRQATVSWPRPDVSYYAALEIALTNYERMDWEYVMRRLGMVARTGQVAGSTMVKVSRRVRARARKERATAGV